MILKQITDKLGYEAKKAVLYTYQIQWLWQKSKAEIICLKYFLAYDQSKISMNRMWIKYLINVTFSNSFYVLFYCCIVILYPTWKIDNNTLPSLVRQ